MSDKYDAELGAVMRAHHCPAERVGSVPIKETFRGQTVWEGVVNVYAVKGHSQVKEAYAWSYKDDAGETQHVVVSQIPPGEGCAYGSSCLRRLIGEKVSTGNLAGSLREILVSGCSSCLSRSPSERSRFGSGCATQCFTESLGRQSCVATMRTRVGFGSSQ